MGIPGFLKHLRETYQGNWITEIPNPSGYDYLFLDFQSIIYSVQGAIGNEINYFIRLIYIYKNLPDLSSKLRFLNTHKNKLLYILGAYPDYFKSLKIDSSGIILNIRKELANSNRDGKMNTTLSLYMTTLFVMVDYKSKWEDFLTKKIIDLVTDLSDKLVNKKEKYSNTYIFFDGIPSKSKIKEQISRRIYPEIIGAIKNSIESDGSLTGDLRIENEIKLNSVKLPSIGPGTDFLINLRSEFGKINDPVKGKFYINSEKILGEAEHQIMKYINDNIGKFKCKKILLSSPDADLILLSFINNTMGFNIDLLRIDKINEETFTFKIEDLDQYNYNKSPFKLIFEYVDTTVLIDLMKLTGLNQKIIDISFILLLLGDDFLPKVPTLKIDNLSDILNAYNNSGVNIIELDSGIYKINHINLLKYLTELIKNDNEIKWDTEAVQFHNNKIKNMSRWAFDGLNLNGKFKLLPQILANKQTIPAPRGRYRSERSKPSPGQEFQHMFYDQKTYLGWLLENKGYFNPTKTFAANILEYNYTRGQRGTSLELDFHKDFFTNFNTVFKRKKSLFNPSKKPIQKDQPTPLQYNAKLKNYLEGYTFILDAYLNNKIRNYEWVYNYHSAPTITEIVTYMSGKTALQLETIFNYVDSSGAKINDIYVKLNYMDISSYRSFMENSKKELLKELAKNIIDKTELDPATNATKKTELDTLSKDEILSRYFTYQNVPIIFDCTNSFYVNKCVEGYVINDLSGYEKPVQVNNDTLEFMNKYIKYKTKYLRLKELLSK